MSQYIEFVADHLLIELECQKVLNLGDKTWFKNIL
jgi:hypothetical protein